MKLDPYSCDYCSEYESTCEDITSTKGSAWYFGSGKGRKADQLTEERKQRCDLENDIKAWLEEIKQENRLLRHQIEQNTKEMTEMKNSLDKMCKNKSQLLVINCVSLEQTFQKLSVKLKMLWSMFTLNLLLCTTICITEVTCKLGLSVFLYCLSNFLLKLPVML